MGPARPRRDRLRRDGGAPGVHDPELEHVSGLVPGGAVREVANHEGEFPLAVSLGRAPGRRALRVADAGAGVEGKPGRRQDVPGYGAGYAGDTGGGVKGRWIDLGYTQSDYESWSGYVDVYYLTPVPEPDGINYLIPTWLP